MEIVIDMPEEKLSIIKNKMYCGIYDPVLYKAIENGTVLPKGHGRIIDESQVTGTFTWDNGFIECFAPTIIEKDKEQE